MKLFLIIILIFLFCQTLSALESSSTILKGNKFTASVLTDSVQKNDVWANFYNKQKPGLAAFYSLIFPGGGQIYNGQYLKAGLFFGGELAYLSYMVSSDAVTLKNLIDFLYIWMAIRGWGVFDAFTSAVDINEQMQIEENKGFTFLYYPKNGVQNVGLTFHF